MLDAPDTNADNTTDDGLIRVDAGGWGLTWAVDDKGGLRQVGLGPTGHLARREAATYLYPDAFPVWGATMFDTETALRVTHCDGTLTTRLVLEGVTQTHESDGEHSVVRCRDEMFDFTVEHHLRTHPDSGVLEQWTEISHDEEAPVRLHDYYSLAPLLLITNSAELHHFRGSGWGDEWRWTTEPLSPGTKSLASLGGLQTHLRLSPCILLSPSGPSSEHEGDVIGLSIAWGGNTRFELDVEPKAGVGSPLPLRIRAGANPHGADYALDPGQRFVTPTVAITWSGHGRQDVTKRFHEWTRARVVRDPDRLRPLVANNWEATEFDFDEQSITGLIKAAGEIGADVFLLDDGWFGTNHPRDDDTTSLGDWDPDPAKLPSGLAPLATAAEEAGIRFGIWVEPEMINPVSDLHDAHPEWVLRNRRDPIEERQQLMLDPLIPEVRDFEVGVVDRTLAGAPGTSYVKWDANRSITDPGSSTLPADRQSNLWVDQVHATWSVMAEVARRHPDVELMLCSSGGGRSDHGTMQWFHEFWLSDNTDPVSRVRMQWACSHFFPASVVASHVTRMGGRPLDFACAVSLSARFGFDIDLVSMPEAELELCRRAVAIARRSQDLVQMGELVRLVSPVEGADRSRAALAYVSADRGRAIVFAYQLEEPSEAAPAITFDCLDPGRTYRVTSSDLDRTEQPEIENRTAADLGSAGLAWHGDSPLTFRIWELEAI